MLDSGPSPEVELSFSLPSEDVRFVDGTVTLQLVAVGGMPDAVELVRGGSPFANLSPPFMYSWDTSSEPEGPVVMEARAVIGSAIVGETSREFTVDRTAPEVRDHVPLEGGEWLVDERISITLSEPVDPATVTMDAVEVEGSTVLDVTLGEDAQTLYVTLERPPWNTQITVTVGGARGISDYVGHGLVEYSFAFRYGDWGVSMFAPFTPGRVLDAFQEPSAETVYVAYTGAESDTSLSVARFDGSSWEPDLGGLVTDTDATQVMVRSSGSAPPVVAWSTPTEFNIARLDAETNRWVPLPSAASIAPIYSHGFDMEVVEDRVYVAWQGHEVSVGELDATGWHRLGDPIARSSGIGGIEIVPTPDGAYLAVSHRYVCYQYQYVDAAWLEGPPLSPTTDYTCETLVTAQTVDGTIWVGGHLDNRRLGIDAVGSFLAPVTNPLTAPFVLHNSGPTHLIAVGDTWLGMRVESTGSTRVFGSPVGSLRLGGSFPDSAVFLLYLDDRPTLLVDNPLRILVPNALR